MSQKRAICFIGDSANLLEDFDNCITSQQSRTKISALEQEVYLLVDKAVKEGIDTFYFGATCGYELMCARQVLTRKKVIKPQDPKSINLVAVIPFEEQAMWWSEEHRDIYYNTLEQCDKIIVLNTRYFSGAYHERNRYILNCSNILVCYYEDAGGDVEYAIKLASMKGMSIVNLCSVLCT